MRSLLLCALLCLTPYTAYAQSNVRVVRAESAPQTPGINVLIVGPETVEYGDFVTLDASGSDADLYSWHLAGATMTTYALSDDGKKVYFSAKPAGKHTFVLAAYKNSHKADPDIDGDTDRPAILTQVSHTIIAGSIPGPVVPPPGPGPVVPPPPPPVDPIVIDPNKHFGLDTFVASLVDKIPLAKRPTAAGLAGNYQTVAQRIRTRKITTLADANTALKSLNGTTVGADKQLWLDAVITPLSAKMALSLGNDPGKITLADLIIAYSEIAVGFSGW